MHLGETGSTSVQVHYHVIIILLKKSENELKYGLIWFNLVFFLLLTNWDFLSRPLFFPGVREGGSGVFVKTYGT